jgi:exosortase/archaeosortase family protein
MAEKNKKPFGFSFQKEDAVKTGRFLLWFILTYLLLSVAIKAIFPIEAIELWVANNVLAILQLAGYSGSTSLAETALIELQSGSTIEISELCTGLMETLIIVGAIVASIGISWRKRLLGAAAAAAATIALNYVRIIATALLILSTSDLALIEFTHNVLFRLFLFVTIAGLYIAWFYWAASSEKTGEKKTLNK